MKITEKFLKDIETNVTKLIQNRAGRKGFEELGSSPASLKQLAIGIRILTGEIDPSMSAWDPSKLSINASKVLASIATDVRAGKRVSAFSDSLNNKYQSVFGEIYKSNQKRSKRKQSSDDDPLSFGGGNLDAASRVKEASEKAAAKAVEDYDAADEAYRIDSMDDYDRQIELLSKKYFRGDKKEAKERAENILRKDLLKRLPKFFKDSDLSTKSLMKIAERADEFPKISKIAGFALDHPRLFMFDAIRNLMQRGMNGSLHARDSYVSAVSSGLGVSELVTRGSSIGGFGGSAKDIAGASGSWLSNIGDILMGGSLDKLIALDRFGINPMGSGPGGFATDEEILERIAKQLPKLDKAKQLALKNNPIIPISNSMFSVMLAHPDDFRDYSNRNDYMKAWGVGDPNASLYGLRAAEDQADYKTAWDAADEQLGILLQGPNSAVYGVKKWAGLGIAGVLKKVNDFGVWFNGLFSDVYDEKSGKWCWDWDEKQMEAYNAAKSADKFESEGGAAGVTNNTNTNSRSVTMNVDNVTVQLPTGDAEGFKKSMENIARKAEYVVATEKADPGFER